MPAMVSHPEVIARELRGFDDVVYVSTETIFYDSGAIRDSVSVHAPEITDEIREVLERFNYTITDERSLDAGNERAKAMRRRDYPQSYVE